MSGTAADIIRVAEGELGKTNGAKYFAYFGYPDLGPWCVAGDRWANAVAGVDFPWHTFYAWDWSDVPYAHVIHPDDLRTGDSISLDWDNDGSGDHVAIVKSVHDWGCSTVEFNAGNPGMVRNEQRLWDNIICGIRPVYNVAEWVKVADGRWWYRHADGSYTRDDWEKIDGEWYYFDDEGWMKVGWLKWRGDWYYLSEWHDGLYGHMVSDGIYADAGTGKTYAFDKNGRMYEDKKLSINVDSDGHVTIA